MKTILHHLALACSMLLACSFSALATPLELSVSKTDFMYCGQATSGSITIAASGGTSPYTYKLSNGTTNQTGYFNQLSEGNYSVIVTDKWSNSISSETISISGQQTLTILSLDIVQPACHADLGRVTINTKGNLDEAKFSIDGINFHNSCGFDNLTDGNYTIYAKNKYGCMDVKSFDIFKIPPMEVKTELIERDYCNDPSNSTLSLDVINGVPPFGYRVDLEGFQSSATFENLEPGTHQFTVIDARGCLSYSSISIEEYFPMQASFFVNDAIVCNGDQAGEIVGVANYGKAPFTYWLNGVEQDQGVFNNLSAGEYQMDITDAMGCTISSEILQLTEPFELKIEDDLTVHHPSCPNDSSGFFTISTTGGTPPYEYYLNGNSYMSDGLFWGLYPGAYQVTVIDANGCVAKSKGIQIDEPSETIIEVQVDDVSCNGADDGNIYVFASGGIPPYEYATQGQGPYTSNNKFSNLSPGQHAVFVRDSVGCKSLLIIESLTEPAILTLDATSVSSSNDNGKILFHGEGGTPPYQYLFFHNGAWQKTLKTETVWLPSGSYAIGIKDNNNCEAYGSVTIESTVGLEELKAATLIYPNPSKGHISIEQNSNKRLDQVVIYDQLGAVAFPTTSINNDLTQLDVLHLSSGIYYMRLSNKTDVLHKTIIIE